MFYLILVASFALAGAFCLGFKVARLVRERRKSRALDYLRETGFYPPVYTGCHEPKPTQPRTKASSGDIVGQVLYIGIVVAVFYVLFVGLT